jgi:hypothetical protein
VVAVALVVMVVLWEEIGISRRLNTEKLSKEDITITIMRVAGKEYKDMIRW